MMKSWLQPRETETRGPDGPLTGAALKRLQMASTAEVADWVDNSLAKVGILIHESRNGGSNPAGLLAAAEEETAALLQAVRELARRV